MANKKLREETIEFLYTYGWAILSGIIAIVVLAYFGVFTTNGYHTIDYKCLAEKMCKDYNLEYYEYYTDSLIECKQLTKNEDYVIFQFEVNYTALEGRYLDCKNHTH